MGDVQKRPNLREIVARASATWSMEHPWLVVLLAAVLTVLSVWALSDLRIVTDLKRLLPETAPSVKRLDELQSRVGNQSDIVVTVRSSDPDGNIRWGARFTALMEAEPTIRFVQFQRDIEELEKSALLYLSVHQLEDIRREVIARIKRNVKKTLELGLDDDDEDEAGGDSGGELPEPGAAARALDDFEDDEDFEAAQPGETARALDDFEGDEDFGRGGAADSTLDDFEDDEDFDQDAEPDGTAEEAAGAAADAGDEPLDIDELKEKYGVEEVPEYYTNDDGTLLIVRARPFADTSDTRVAQKLVDMTRANIEKAKAADDPPDLRISLKGHHLERTEEVKSVQGNMATSAGACLVVLLAIVGLYFRRSRAILLVAVPLVMSVLWSLGVAWLVYGYLNIISAFIFAVLLGLGIDYGIHVLARYDEARRAGDDHRAAVLVALTTTGVAAASGALTTSVVFFLLTVGDFQGFAQFGLVAGFGVLIALLAVFTVMPALTTLLERVRPWRTSAKASGGGKPRSLYVPSFRAATVLSFLILCASVFAAVLSAVHLPDLEFEYAFEKLGSRSKLEAKKEREERMARGEGTEEDREEYKDVIGRHSMGAPTVVMPPSLELTEVLHRQFETMEDIPEALKMALLAAEKPEDVRHPQIVAALDNLPPGDPDRLALLDGLDRLAPLLEMYPVARLKIMAERLNKVVSIFSFVPHAQEEKLPIIEDIRVRLERKKNVFKGEEREQLDELMGYLSPKTLSYMDLPEWIRVQFKEPDGEHIGRFLILRTKGSKTDIQNTSLLKEAYFDLEVEGTHVPSAGTYFVLPEIIETIQREGALIIGLALLGLVIILLYFLRRLVAMITVLVPLCLAVLWTCGIYVALGLKLNFYNVVVVPLLFGMGIDHGIHIYTRFVEGRGRHIARVIRETGSAITAATVTTLVGFAGLFFADNVGLNTMGTLAIIGMALALVAATLTLPAMLHLWRASRILAGKDQY